MHGPERADAPAPEALLREHVALYPELAPDDQRRLREIAQILQSRQFPRAFILFSLRSTAEVLQEIRRQEEAPDNAFRREHVRRFMEQNPVSEAPAHARVDPRRERKREERDRLQALAMRLIREARQARGRHEVKKTRSMLLKLDQRELRRVLGREGDDLCRQINDCLRNMAPLL
jgi:hypothetical protein